MGGGVHGRRHTGVRLAKAERADGGGWKCQIVAGSRYSNGQLTYDARGTFEAAAAQVLLIVLSHDGA